MKELYKKIVIGILTLEARIVLKKYQPKIIAITGSVGKTSTKDAIFTIMNKQYFTWRSKKSFNSESGVPLTILNCPTGWNNPFLWLKNIFKGLSLIVFRHPYPQWLILEIGADRPGDIQKVSKWLPIDIAVITYVGDVPVHVEFYESPDEVLHEKSFLMNALTEDATLILNADDERVHSLKEQAKCTTIMYGTHEDADVRADSIELAYTDGKPAGVRFVTTYNNEQQTVHMPEILGKHHTYTALAALSAAMTAGISLEQATASIAGYVPPPGRLRLLNGVKEARIIDDTYNAAPAAMMAGLETLRDIRTEGKRIAILGDMLELGDYAVETHKQIGKHAAEACDYLFLVGPRSRYIAQGALLGGLSEKRVREFDDARLAGKHVELMVEKGDIVFVKGSQGIRMEKAVEELMEHPENKHQVLVRQEKEWMLR